MDDDAALARAELTACLHRVSKGERSALAELYRRTSAKLFGICQRILPDQSAAEDVLQEVFVTVWRKAGQFDASLGVSPITWLAAIARNRALDRLRAGRRPHTTLDDAMELPDLAPLADANLEVAERADALAACLAALDVRSSMAIRAAFFGGQTYAALAQQAQIPLATMKSVIRRGLLQLRKCLDHG